MRTREENEISISTFVRRCVKFDTSGANFLRMREVYCKFEFDSLHFYGVFFTWGTAFVRRCVTSDTWFAESLHFYIAKDTFLTKNESKMTQNGYF